MLTIKKIPYLPVFILLLVAVVMAIVCFHTLVIPPNTLQKQFYSYEPFISSQANDLQPGDQVTITWAAYPITSNHYSKETPLKLETLLVPESTFRAQPFCGKAVGATMIDQISTTNTAGKSFTRHVSLPPDMQPGQYELLRKIWSSTGSVCFGTTVTVAPKLVVPHLPISAANRFKM